jgi:hypothetical protein
LPLEVLTNVFCCMERQEMSLGKLVCVRWAKILTNPCWPLPPRIMAYDLLPLHWTAPKGHLGLVQWARANKCLWEAGVCASAAFYSHAHVLRWLAASGCPWDEQVCANALYAKRNSIFCWASVHGAPWGGVRVQGGGRTRIFSAAPVAAPPSLPMG